jgi:hypothetical protein
VVDPDATVRIERNGQAAPASLPPPAPAPAAPARGSRSPILIVAAGLLLLAGIGIAGWVLIDTRPDEPPPKPEPVALAPPPRSVAPPAPVPAPAPPRPGAANEQAIREHRAVEPTLFALAGHPRIFVIDFPDLDRQGATLNRVAALIEKAGVPRDHVLDDVALASAIARSGETPATYYFGHNYRGRDIERFFALADRDGVALTPDEEWLRGQVARIRAALPMGDEFAIVSVPGIEQRVDASMRAAILHHELGHGHFFTNPAFATHVARVWREVFTDAERARFRAFLAREGYDPSLEEVMLNEAMAYLIFTPDPRFFTPAHAGLDDARAEELRAALRAGAPM